MFIKKMTNTSGASIFIALLFFLMCSLAGSVVLTAASSSAGRLANLKEDEQSYYSVVSAAKLLKQEIKGKKYIGYKIKQGSGEVISVEYNKERTSEWIQEFLNKAADEVFKSSEGSSSGNRKPIDTWIITVPDSPLDKVKVKAEIYIGKDNDNSQEVLDTKKYNITIELSQLPQENRNYTLSIPAVVHKYEEVINNEEKQIKEITTVIWQEGEIRKN